MNTTINATSRAIGRVALVVVAAALALACSAATAQASHYFTVYNPAGDCTVEHNISYGLQSRETRIQVRPPKVYAFDGESQIVEWRPTILNFNGERIGTANWRQARAYDDSPAAFSKWVSWIFVARSGNVSASWNDWRNNNSHRVKIEVRWWLPSGSWWTKSYVDPWISVYYTGNMIVPSLQYKTVSQTYC